jgi:hypothetical protein
MKSSCIWIPAPLVRKENAHRFPVLSQLTKQLLAIPPTSAPNERIFSLAGRVVSKEKNRTGDEKVSKMIFVNYNLNKNQKEQDEHNKMLKKLEELEEQKKLAALAAEKE